MTQYGGYFDAENSQIVDVSKIKNTIRKLKEANVIEHDTNKLNIEAFVRFISNDETHKNESGKIIYRLKKL